MESVRERMHELGVTSLALTMGHADGGEARLLLSQKDRVVESVATSIPTDRTHGTGCLLSSSVASRLAHGRPLAESVEAAHQWVSRAVKHGHRFKSGGAPDPMVVVD